MTADDGSSSLNEELDGEQAGAEVAPESLLDFLRSLDGPITRRELMDAFRVKGGNRTSFRRLLKQLEDSGAISIDSSKRVRLGTPRVLPKVTVVEVTGTDMDGEPQGRPVKWERPGEPPAIIVTESGGRAASLRAGERVLAELTPLEDGRYEARVMRRLQPPPPRIIGVFETGKEGLRVRPTDKKARSDFQIRRENAGEAKPGDLVLAEPVTKGRKHDRMGLPEVRVVEVLGNMAAPRAVSLIAIHTHDIPVEFPPEAWEIAEQATPPAADDPARIDLRSLPLVTIDGADARDFDDAVHATPDDDPDNPGGWKLTVAIADVSYYVRHGSALDEEAQKRGNSVYFPDRVVPMLPERLSNDLCSLRPDGDRPCLAARMRINAGGELIDYRFERAWMRSHARLTYEQAQAAHDGAPEPWIKPLLAEVIEPLYAAYTVLDKHRQDRGTLDLDLPEPVIEFDDQHKISRIAPRARLDSHKLIEEFMITANVAAAQALDGKQQPALYRVHDSPDKERIAGLSDILKGLGISLAKGQVIRPAHLNNVLKEVEGHDDQRLINQLVLRAQAQARYAPHCSGHFGLALRHYTHFTSPIRRYSDLIVHRALISLYGLGDDGLSEAETADLEEIAEHISNTERTAIAAERSANDRYMALYLSEHGDTIFHGRISGVGKFGLFVNLSDIGADGLIPMRSLPDDFYIHDEKAHALIGRRWGRMFRLGKPVFVTVVRTDPISGMIDLALHESTPEEFGKGSGGEQRREGRSRFSKPGSSGPRDRKGPKTDKAGKRTTPRAKQKGRRK
jgi:ribonuclease R